MWFVERFEHDGNELKITGSWCPRNDEEMLVFLKKMISPSGVLWQISREKKDEANERKKS